MVALDVELAAEGRWDDLQQAARSSGHVLFGVVRDGDRGRSELDPRSE